MILKFTKYIFFLILLVPFTAKSSGFDMTNHSGQGEGCGGGSGSGSTAIASSEKSRNLKESWKSEIGSVRDRIERLYGSESVTLDTSTTPSTLLSDEEIARKVAASPEIQSYDQAIARLHSFKNRRDQAREEIEGMENYEVRNETIDEATQWAKSSREYYKEENFEEGNIALTIAETLLDIAISVTPVIGWGRDCYEAALGKDLLSGEELDTFSRTVAIVGVLTAGFGSKIGKAAKVFKKTIRAENGIDATVKATKVIDSAKRVSGPNCPTLVRLFLGPQFLNILD